MSALPETLECFRPKLSAGVRLLSFAAAVIPFLFYFNPLGIPIFTGYLIYIVLIFGLIARKVTWRFGRMLSPIALIYFAIVLSLIQTDNFGPALIRVTHLTIGFVAFSVVFNLVRHEYDVEQVMKAFLSPAWLIASLGLVGWFVTNVLGNMYLLHALYEGTLGTWLYGARDAQEIAKFFADTGAYYSLRKGTTVGFLGQFAAIGAFSVPVQNGMYSAILILGDLCFSKDWTARRIIVQGMLWLNLLLTQSRTAWIALALALVLHWWWSRHETTSATFPTRMSHRAMIAVGLLCVSVLIAVIAFVGLENMLLQLASPFVALVHPSADAYTTSGRLAEFGLTADLVSRFPITGIGFDKAINTIYTHNEYFNIVIFTGVFGLIAYLWFTLLPFVSSIRLARMTNVHPILRNMGRLYKRLAVLWLVAAFGESKLVNPKDYLPYWLLTGLLMSAVLIAKRSGHE